MNNLQTKLRRTFVKLNEKYFNNKLRCRLFIKDWKCQGGQCDYDSITIAKRIIEAGGDIFIDTLKHEMAHLSIGAGKGHGKIWKAEMIRIGGRPSAFLKEKVKAHPYKYIVECPECHEQWGYYRKGKTVKNPKNYHCNNCGCKLKRIK